MKTFPVYVYCMGILLSNVRGFGFGDIFHAVTKTVTTPIENVANTATHDVVNVATNPQVQQGVLGGAMGKTQGLLEGTMTGNPEAMVMDAAMVSVYTLWMSCGYREGLWVAWLVQVYFQGVEHLCNSSNK